tara:strand:- start:4342 stop:4569 length:228 start_codon:yes stop_codon:yes gene_type:complete
MRNRIPKKQNNLTVYPRRNESAERMVKRFNKKVKKMGIIDEAKERRYYAKPSEVKRKRNKRSDARRKKEEAKRKK